MSFHERIQPVIVAARATPQITGMQMQAIKNLEPAARLQGWQAATSPAHAQLLLLRRQMDPTTKSKKENDIGL